MLSGQLGNGVQSHFSCAAGQVDTTAENSELLQDRRKRLERLLKPPRGEAAQNIARDIVLSEALVGKGEAMFRESLPHGLGSPLQPGFGKRTECDVALRRLLHGILPF